MTGVLYVLGWAIGGPLAFMFVTFLITAVHAAFFESHGGESDGD